MSEASDSLVERLVEDEDRREDEERLDERLEG